MHKNNLEFIHSTFEVSIHVQIIQSNNSLEQQIINEKMKLMNKNENQNLFRNSNPRSVSHVDRVLAYVSGSQGLRPGANWTQSTHSPRVVMYRDRLDVGWLWKGFNMRHSLSNLVLQMVGVRNQIFWLKLQSPWDGNRPSSTTNQLHL